MTDIYSNLLTQYVYGEKINDLLEPNVKLLLKSNVRFRRLYEQLRESRTLIERNIRILHPRKSLVDNILRYAASVQ